MGRNTAIQRTKCPLTRSSHAEASTCRSLSWATRKSWSPGFSICQQEPCCFVLPGRKPFCPPSPAGRQPLLVLADMVHYASPRACKDQRPRIGPVRATPSDKYLFAYRRGCGQSCLCGARFRWDPRGVLATAGVQGNAMRSSVDAGNYVEPGTINLIILTNRKLYWVFQRGNSCPTVTSILCPVFALIYARTGFGIWDLEGKPLRTMRRGE